MADQVLEQWRVTEAFLALLRAGTGKTVFDSEIPATATLPVVVPPGGGAPVPDVYYVVYEIDGGGLDGPWGAPNADATLIYQVTSVGPRSRRQARAAADLARRTVIQRADKTAANDGYAVPLPVDAGAGWACISRLLVNPGGSEPSGNEQSHPFTVAERFAVTVTPS